MSSDTDDRIRAVRIAQDDVTEELSAAFGFDVIGVVPTDDDEEYELLVGDGDD